MNLSNDLLNLYEFGNTDGSSKNLNEDISEKDVNKKSLGDGCNVDSQTEFFSSLNNNLENHQTQGSQSQLTIISQNIKNLKLPHQESPAVSKRPRTKYTSDQIYEMEVVFRETRYISQDKKKMLAQKLNLDELKIKVWFQNRRMKEKKIEQNPNQIRNEEPPNSNEQSELGNANNIVNLNPPIQQYRDYQPSTTLNGYRNNSSFLPPSSLSEEYVRNVGYPNPISGEYFNNQPMQIYNVNPGLQSFPRPVPVIPQSQYYQNYNSMYGNLQNPHFSPKNY